MEQLLRALDEARWPEEQDIYVLAIGRLLDEPAPTADCAWCNREAGRPQGTGSHGVCIRHGNEMVAQSQARKARRAA